MQDAGQQAQRVVLQRHAVAAQEGCHVLRAPWDALGRLLLPWSRSPRLERGDHGVDDAMHQPAGTDAGASTWRPSAQQGTAGVTGTAPITLRGQPPVASRALAVQTSC